MPEKANTHIALPVAEYQEVFNIISKCPYNLVEAAVATMRKGIGITVQVPEPAKEPTSCDTSPS